MPTHVLIIDDDPVQRRLVEANVVSMGLHPIVEAGGAAGLDALARGREGGQIAAVVLDLMMPGVTGLDVLFEMRRLGQDIPVVVQTAKGGVETVVAAMRAGAFDFVVKPVSPERLRRAISNAVRMRDASRHRPRRAAEAAGPRPLDAPASAAMRPVLRLAAKAAASTIPVLIEGETGVGKEWLAEAIRLSGPRAAAPFVVVNCGALPAELVESILFGHEKGAFTGAGERREGKFLSADGGTIFLDEIGELTQDVQVKLLRVLQSGEIDPVGGRGSVHADVRILSATNRDLAADVRAGRFREDLYWRLNVLSLRVPPLRERRGEIAGLAEGFLRRFAGERGRGGPPRLSVAAIDLLERYDWPGNIRQLENAIHRAVVLAEDDLLGTGDFPQIAAFVTGADPALDDTKPAPDSAGTDGAAGTAGEERGGPSGGLAVFDAAGEVRTAEAVEADLIRLAMAHYGGRMTEIARRLGIGRSTLYRKMLRYSIAEPGSPARWEDRAQTLPETSDPEPSS